MVSRRHLLKLSALGTASFAAPLAYSASNITMTHNTGNPIGSTSPKDLSDNARNLDYLSLGPNPSYPDRKGVARKSWSGMESEFRAGQVERDAQFSAFMDASGYEPPVPYAPGIKLVRLTQTVTYQGSQYRVRTQFLPLTTTVWASDEQKLKLIGDDSLRQDMANSTDPTKGAAILGRGGVVVASIVGLSTCPKRADIAVIVKDYHPSIHTDGGGRFHYDPIMPKSAHDGGTVFSPTVPWNGTKATLPGYLVRAGETDPSGMGCWVRRVEDQYLITMFGAVPDWSVEANTGFDNRPSIEASMRSVYHTVIPKGNFGVAAGGSIFAQGLIGKRISGGGELHKMGAKGIFSFKDCIDIKLSGIILDGQIVRDEAENGNIWDGSRLSENFAFAVSFVNCTDCEVRAVEVYDFAWDGLRATGTVASGGATAVQSSSIYFIENKLRNIRGSQLWFKAISGGKINGNRQRNDVTFAQKGNAIFIVEWCADIEVAHNRQYSSGDNGVGIGEPDNNNVAARNKRINTHNNSIFMTRYHAILIAQAEDSLTHNNLIHRAGAKSEMAGKSGAVVCGAITLLGGGSAPANLRNKVYSNVIVDPYEHGIYARDRMETLFANASSGLELYDNTISGFGKLATATRLSSSGITTQLQIAPILRGNITQDGVGDGLRVFGDADISEHRAFRIIGKGIHIPTDTLLGNTRLSSPLTNCETADTTETGISIWTKDRVQLIGCKALRAGRGGSEPSAEDTVNALQHAGIALRSVKTASLVGCGARECGAAGLVTQFCPVVKDTDGEWSKNGHMYKATYLKAGVYAEGDEKSAVKLTLINPVMEGGATQYQPVRVLYGHTDSVALDPEFSNHTSVSIGLAIKKLINI